MRPRIFLAFVYLSVCTAHGDALLPIVWPDPFSAAVACEKIFSYEGRVARRFTVLPWAGCGILWSVYQHDMGFPAIPAGGIEAALEGRYYFADTEAQGFFTGIYAGGTMMFPSYLVYGTSLGLKAGYKKIVTARTHSRFVAEPYVSVSTSPYSVWNLGRNDLRIGFYGVILTASVRLTHEWGRFGSNADPGEGSR